MLGNVAYRSEPRISLLKNIVYTLGSGSVDEAQTYKLNMICSSAGSSVGLCITL